MTNRLMLLASISGFLWVAIGAMLGHQHFDALSMSYLGKAQRYHIVHTIVIMILSVKPTVSLYYWVASCYLLGILCFSGALYLMAVFAWPLNYIVPIGGVSFLGGWLLLIIGQLSVVRI